MKSHVCDVVVVGAGLAGLYAARRLAAAGVDVIVVEAQKRVGGRTWTEHLDGDAFIDHGGQWVSPGQDRILALAEELGVSLFPSWGEGAAVDWSEGVRSTYQGMFPPSAPEAEPAARKAAAKLARMAQSVPLDAPWTAREAAAWDGETLQGWLRANVASDRARTALARAIEGVFAGVPINPSLLAALFCVHSGDALVPFVSDDPGPELRFVGGAQQLSIRMAEALGKRVILDAWVGDIAHDEHGVRVMAGDHLISARQAIVTLPPPLAGRLRYRPALPAARDHLTQHMPMGWVIKAHCVYRERFWLNEGLSALVTSDAGAVRVTADNSPPSGSPGILVGFVEGAEARRLAPAGLAARRAAVLADFVRYFGPEAGAPLAYRDTSWGDDEFARGAYGGYLSPGVWTAYGAALRAPIGPLHWAGAETSAVWNGKMEGALRSGERAAQEVLEGLG